MAAAFIYDIISTGSADYEFGLNFIYNSAQLRDDLGYVGQVYIHKSSKYKPVVQDNYRLLYYAIKTKEGRKIVQLELVNIDSIQTNLEPRWEVKNYKVLNKPN